MIIHHLHECGLKPAYQDNNTALLPHRIPTRKGTRLVQETTEIASASGFQGGDSEW